MTNHFSMNTQALFPYHSHFRIPKDMGIVWETYHKGVLLLGVSGITLEILQVLRVPYGVPKVVRKETLLTEVN